MTTHAVAYESLGSRYTQNGSLRPDQSFQQLITIADASTAASGIVERPLIPPSGYNTNVPVKRVSGVVNGDTDIWFEAIPGTDFVSVGGTATDNGQASISKTVRGFDYGRLSPPPYLDFQGEYPDNPTTAAFSIDYSYQNETYMGLAHFCEFEEHPQDSNADGSVRLAELLALFNQSTSRYVLGIDGSSSAVEVRNCGFAACAPHGAVFIRPEDVGNSNPDQIPTSCTDNLASRFRFHPSVFYPAGKAKYVRSISRQAVDTVALDDASGSGGPIEVITVDSAPSTSNWLVSVDGQFVVVQLNHPAGSDYRRPRDIWNNVWQPILQGSPSAASATLFGSASASNGGSIGFRWAYADYFQCLPLPGTRITQSGVG